MSGRKYQAGQKVRIVADGAAHKIPLGTVITVAKIDDAGRICPVEKPGWVVYQSDVGPAVFGKSELADELKKHRKAAYLAQCKLEYLEEVKKDAFEDNEEFRKFQMRKIITNENVTVEDRIERIEALFNKE